ncbi:MAG: type II toxin-antitoxin system VapC family toxin [Thermodesulfobacteriota bacterium]
MRAVVDTNVVAYFLLGTEPFRAECADFWRRVDDPAAPASWEAELVNVLWMAARKSVLEVPEALHCLELARALGIRSVDSSSLWQGALVRACASGIAAYDTLFVELAEREGVPLATFDEAVIRSFPRVARRPRRVLGR